MIFYFKKLDLDGKRALALQLSSTKPLLEDSGYFFVLMHNDPLVE